VGAAAGLVGSLFFWGLEVTERLVLEGLAGYELLRAGGEAIVSDHGSTPFRFWVLVLLPAVGALAGGIVSWKFAPETRGGGADQIIEDFHLRAGFVRRRVPTIKLIASILTLGFGGSGGREGPTMQVGGALGSLVGRYLRVTERERRILLVAGLAAGMAAVFRTPLGAALLGVELMHRDDFESDALVPSVLASVIAYSVFISFFGEATLFSHAPRYPFIPSHLPLYALMAVLVSLAANFFLFTLNGVQKLSARISLPEWCKPGIGGLLLGLFTVPVLVVIGPLIGGKGQGLGLLGGGYGLAQVAITGAPWFAEGWRGVQLLLVLGVAKILATSLTIGSGGSAGDFGPSLVIGGIFGGAFGRAAQLLLHDPTIQPGAFALVGMGTFYGGLAHIPIASLVMVCELAGSYDLLVPLMLAEGIAFVILRHRALYHSQVNTKRDSPAHRDELILDVLKDIRIGDVVVQDRPFITFRRGTPARQVIQQLAGTEWQDAFPVLGEDGKVVGVISSDILRTMAADPTIGEFTLADDMMTAPVSVNTDDDLHTALELLLHHGAREVLVTDQTGKIIGFLDEAEISQFYHGATVPKPD
jgi:CIC family chloride channel protein